MYCKNCGNKIEESSAFCTKCGMKIDLQNTKASDYKNTPKNNKKVIKKIIVIAALMIGFICLVVGIKKTNVTNSAREVAVASTKYLMEGKISKYYKLLAPPYKEYMCGRDGWYTDEDEFKKDIEDLKNEKKQTMINDCGKPTKMKYYVDYTIACDAEELNAVKSELARDYNYDPDDIQDAMVVSITINATGPNGQSNWTDKNSCVKIHGKWYVHRPGFESVD